MFNEITLEQQTNILAGYLRDDPLFESKNKEGEPLRKILQGLATQWIDFRNTLNKVVNEYNPKITTDLISEWESLVGIPDGCIKNTGTLEKRRLNILLKLAGINATTKKQFENIAKVLGYDIEVETGVDTSTFPMTFPIILMNQAEAPFIIVVSLDASLKPAGFPLKFPMSFTSDVPDILKCLFNKLKPAHCKLYFRYK
jgi:uncharacterized protein YmfQ (DUF2313 family)